MTGYLHYFFASGVEFILININIFRIFLLMQEKTAVLESLKERALLVEKTFNSMKGMKCNVVAGAMYAFPKFTIPEKAVKEAKVSCSSI